MQQTHRMLTNARPLLQSNTFTTSHLVNTAGVLYSAETTHPAAAGVAIVCRGKGHTVL